jgi:hypothetical protein
MRFAFTLTLMVAGAAGLSANALGQPSSDVSGLPLLRTDRTITVQFRGETAADALTSLGKAAGIEVRFAPGLTVTTPITLDFRDARIADAFKTVIEAAGLSYAVMNDTLVVVAARIYRGRSYPQSRTNVETGPGRPTMRMLADQARRMLLTR